jgi:hypothetical protein
VAQRYLTSAPLVAGGLSRSAGAGMNAFKAIEMVEVGTGVAPAPERATGAA